MSRAVKLQLAAIKRCFIEHNLCGTSRGVYNDFGEANVTGILLGLFSISDRKLSRTVGELSQIVGSLRWKFVGEYRRTRQDVDPDSVCNLRVYTAGDNGAVGDKNARGATACSKRGIYACPLRLVSSHLISSLSLPLSLSCLLLWVSALDEDRAVNISYEILEGTR